MCGAPARHSVRRSGFRFWKQKHVTLFLLVYYRKSMATATCFPADTRSALVEFSLLESWLASSSALQLPLHQIESQQQAKGREVQRLLLQAHLQHRGNGDIGPALQLEQADGAMLYSHRRLRCPIPYHRLWNRGTRPYGLLTARRAEHLPDWSPPERHLANKC